MFTKKSISKKDFTQMKTPNGKFNERLEAFLPTTSTVILLPHGFEIIELKRFIAELKKKDVSRTWSAFQRQLSLYGYSKNDRVVTKVNRLSKRGTSVLKLKRLSFTPQSITIQPSNFQPSLYFRKKLGQAPSNFKHIDPPFEFQDFVDVPYPMFAPALATVVDVITTPIPESPAIGSPVRFYDLNENFIDSPIRCNDLSDLQISTHHYSPPIFCSCAKHSLLS
jgi:hypothetical protein